VADRRRRRLSRGLPQLRQQLLVAEPGEQRATELHLEAPQQLPNIIDDPSYPLPDVLTGVPATGGTAAVPKAIGTEIGPPPSAFGDVNITKGTILGAGCSADSPRIGPGWYDDIDVSGCLILDPVHNYADPNDADDDGDFVETDVPQGQQAGIFYITGTLNVNNNSLVVGDGISLVLRETSNQPALQVNGDGAVDVNTGVTGVNRKKAAFKTDGNYSYTFNTTLNVWEYTANNLDKSTTGVAVYAVKPDQTGNTTSDASTDLIKVAAGAALAWQGILYAPRDNIVLSGQPSHDDIGQFICWTVKIAGGTTINQTYDGPGERRRDSSNRASGSRPSRHDPLRGPPEADLGDMNGCPPTGGRAAREPRLARGAALRFGAAGAGAGTPGRAVLVDH
jgi:hypothetical protein